MFDPRPTATPGPAPSVVRDPGWGTREPLPGDAGYAAYLAYEDQQIAFWNAWAARDGSVGLPSGSPNLNGARSDASLLAEVGRQARRVNMAEGAKLRAIADYANRRIANPVIGPDERMMRHTVEAEIGLELRLAPSTASRWLHLALTLTRRLPTTLATLESGDLTRMAAEMIADETENLNVAQCARLEEQVLPDAASRSHRSLRNKVRRTVEKLDADAVRKRAEKAAEERTVYVKDESDGMATLCLYGPATVVRSLYDALNDKVLTAQASRKAGAANTGADTRIKDDRRLGAQRHDTVVDVLATALGIDPWAPPVPASSFLTQDQIAALDRNADTYRPSEAMRRAIRARDKHCRFPGCRRPARFCDIDHTIAFQVGGRTVYANLGCLCRMHHQVKQLPGWHLEQDHGRFVWTAPNGIRFIVHPPGDGDDEDDHPDFARPSESDEIPF